MAKAKKKFIVLLSGSTYVSASVEVEASSEEDAKEQALGMVDDADVEFETQGGVSVGGGEDIEDVSVVSVEEDAG